MFGAKFGNTLLSVTNAEYYGGHKAYLAGGMFSDFQAGSLAMTENYLIFQTNDKDNAKRWEIIIPFKDVIVSGWGVEEVTRRKQVSGFGGIVETLLTNWDMKKCPNSHLRLQTEKAKRLLGE
jgi:hypothetical protein